MQPVGTVYLIGAGPGDPGLMTVKGLNTLRRADAVLYDALVNPVLLKETPATAELIDVGKRAGCHRLSQTEINHLLIELAHTCRTVVRLKGGDPFVFGRGSEEMQALVGAGVPVQVVPGVSSATAALAYAGVPVTHRHTAASVGLITGHRAAEAEGGHDWAALARLDTLVILMGLRNLPTISERLIEYGLDPQRPALAVRWGTMPEQEVVSGTLGTLAAQVAEVGLKTPAIIVIGEVATLAETLRWFPAIYHHSPPPPVEAMAQPV